MEGYFRAQCKPEPPNLETQIEILETMEEYFKAQFERVRNQHQPWGWGFVRYNNLGWALKVSLAHLPRKAIINFKVRSEELTHECMTHLYFLQLEISRRGSSGQADSCVKADIVRLYNILNVNQLFELAGVEVGVSMYQSYVTETTEDGSDGINWQCKVSKATGREFPFCFTISTRLKYRYFLALYEKFTEWMARYVVTHTWAPFSKLFPCFFGSLQPNLPETNQA